MHAAAAKQKCKSQREGIFVRETLEWGALVWLVWRMLHVCAVQLTFSYHISASSPDES